MSSESFVSISQKIDSLTDCRIYMVSDWCPRLIENCFESSPIVKWPAAKLITAAACVLYNLLIERNPKYLNYEEGAVDFQWKAWFRYRYLNRSSSPVNVIYSFFISYHIISPLDNSGPYS